MTAHLDPAVGGMTGVAALPRRNGEVAFDAPWQGRALGMAVALVERSGAPWDDFRRHLVAAIAADLGRPYWESWVAALEAFALHHGLVAVGELPEPTANG